MSSRTESESEPILHADPPDQGGQNCTPKHFQWMRRNGFDASRNPILRPLETIECRDAVLNPDGSEAPWPASEFIIGNPPFLGAKLMKRRLGPDYTDQL